MVIKYTILYIFLLLIFLYIIPKKNLESFEDSDKNKNEENYRFFAKYSQNYDKPWKKKVQSSNFSTIYDYPTSFIDLYRVNEYIFNDFSNDDMKKFAKKISSNYDIKFLEKDVNKVLSIYEINYENKKTLSVKKDWRPNINLVIDYTKSRFKEIDEINKYFLYRINKLFNNFIKNNLKKKKEIFIKDYFILNYKISNIYFDENHKLFNLIVNIIRNNSYLVYTFYINGLFIKQNNKFYFKKMNVKYIGNNTFEKYLLLKSLNKYNTKFNINPLYTNRNNIFNENLDNLLLKKKIDIEKEKNFLNFSYSCFGYEKDSKNPEPVTIFATDLNDCQNKINIIGQSKPSGVWDKPCIKDEECIFYKKNKNYKNSYGRCINNKCQLPLNMKNLGYHYYVNHKTAQPLCYNCNNKNEWLPFTILDFCCEEQKDKKKYPKLNGPDYAFENDTNNRENYYLQKYCSSKPIYNNIFSEPSLQNIKCRGRINFKRKKIK